MKLQQVYHSIVCRQDHLGVEEVGIEFFNESGDIIYFYRGLMPTVKMLAPSNYNGRSAKRFTLKYGITPRTFCKIVAGVIMKEVVKPHPEWDKLFYTKRGWGHCNKFEHIKYEPEMQQCRKDGIPNIIPFVGKLGMSPQELKEYFGAAKWKKICKNSYSRNKLLANTSFLRNADENILNLRSNALKYVHNDRCAIPMKLIDDIRKSLKFKSYKSLHKNASYLRAYNIVADTVQLVPDAKLTWSYRRFKEEHENMYKNESELRVKRRVAEDSEYRKKLDINFKDLHPWLEPVEFETGVKAVPLLNMQGVLSEGSKMRHCVGSYAEMSARGEYVVWHLTKDDVEATLGVNVSHRLWEGKKYPYYTFQQMYGMCNTILEDRDFREAADWIVDTMNRLATIQSNETQLKEGYE